MRPPLTSFIGRRHELSRLRDLLSASRLITITGAGGAGKTRLAEEFAASLARSLDRAIAAAYLAGASGPSDVVDVVAVALGLVNRGTRPDRDELIDYVGERRLLLVLDNCEHVAAAAAELVADLLRACPGLLIVATSRRPLHVPGEQLFPIEGLAHDRAIELFVDRARHADPDFAADGAHAEQIAGICSRLEGMPLAIELAAGQVRSLGLAELASGLDSRLPELASRSTVAPERQRTLRATVAWSYDLLPEDRQVAWRRLSVFSGGFTIDAARRVLAAPPIDHVDIGLLVGDLVDQSMVVFDPSRDRYRLIEALREIARERLDEADEEAADAARHRAWMLDLARDSEVRWFSPDQVGAVDRLEAEIGNLRAALERCEADGAFEDALWLANAGFWYWLTRASLDEGVRWYRRLLGRSGNLALEAHSYGRAGYLSTIRLDFNSAHEFLDAAVDLATRAHDPVNLGYATDAGRLLMLYEEPERAQEAQRLLAEVLEQPARDTMLRQWDLIGYGLAALAAGDLDECRRACLDAVQIGRDTGEIWGRELGLRFLGEAEWRAGRHDAAEAALLECVRLDRELHDLWHMGWATEALGWVAADTGRFERSARLLGIAAGVWARAGLSIGFPYRAWHDLALETLRSRLGQRRLETGLPEGRALSWDDAIAFALSEAAPASRSEESVTPLSDRELEIAALVAEGLTNRAIAERLFLSPRTVAKHVEHVMDKLAVGSRAEIASWHARRST